MLGRRGRHTGSESFRVPDRPWKLLLAGDDADSVELMNRLLQRAGHKVTLADTRLEVLGRLGQHEAHALVLDVTRPSSGDAMHVVEAVRTSADPEVVRVPILIAGSATVSAIFAIELGADDVVRRPFTPDALMSALTAMVQRGPDERLAYRRRRLSEAMRGVGSS